MVTKEVLDYVKSELQKGRKWEEIKDTLRKSGWQEPVLEEMNAIIKPQGLVSPPSPVPVSVSTSPSEITYNAPIEKKPTPFFSAKYYQGLLWGTEKLSIFGILSILVFINLIRPSWQIIKFLRPLSNNLDSKFSEIINTLFPKDLEIKIKKGSVSTNVPEPYYVTAPRQLLDIIFPPEKGQLSPTTKIRLMAIDTKGSVEDFERYQAMALLTGNSLVYYNDDKITVYPLRNIQDITINKEIVTKKYSEINRNNRIGFLLKLAQVILPLLLAISMYFGFWAEIFIASLLVLLLVKIRQKNFTFTKIFNFTAGLYFLPTLVTAIITQSFKNNLFFQNGKISFSLVFQNETFSTILILGFAYTLLSGIVQNENDLNHN